MEHTKIDELTSVGQSIWLDSISRSMLTTGRLQELINIGLRGLTSNPTIFDKAISGGNDYDDHIAKLHRLGRSTFEVYDELTVKDIQDAADLFRPVYEKTGGTDGYVSLEINPKLAFQTDETIKEGRRLHRKVNRPNVMFKVPSTDRGFVAIEELLSAGINVNITLIFSLEQYERTAQAYLRGLKKFLRNNGDLSTLASVASVFVSRVDTAVDRQIDEKTSGGNAEGLKSLRGKAAVANCKMIFQRYLKIFSGEEFKALETNGARVQRVLWGSTGTKDPGYSDIKYVTELIGGPTVNTLPEKTLEAFLDHGLCTETLTENVRDAEETIAELKRHGIDITEVCTKLLHDGVVAFEKSFDSLLRTIDEKNS